MDNSQAYNMEPTVPYPDSNVHPVDSSMPYPNVNPASDGGATQETSVDQPYPVPQQQAMDNKGFDQTAPPAYAPAPAANQAYAAPPPQQFVQYQTPNTVQNYPLAECCCGLHVKNGMMIIFQLEVVFIVLSFMNFFEYGGNVALIQVSISTVLLVVGIVCGVIALTKDEPTLLMVYLIALYLRLFLSVGVATYTLVILIAYITYVDWFAVILIVLSLGVAIALTVYCNVVTQRCMQFMRSRMNLGLPPTDMWGKHN